MFDFVFESLYTTDSTATLIGSKEFFLCCLVSIVCGVIVSIAYMFKQNYNKGFVVTLAVMPLIVQMVITLVNGNLGAGIAVMGVFNLVRFRTIPGTAKDIASVFLTMAIGLATGMGFVLLAVVFTVLVTIVNIVLAICPLGKNNNPPLLLKVTVPEDLEFEGMFDQALSDNCDKHALVEARTTNMGSLYRLTYEIHLKSNATQKTLIDAVRTLNGNLAVTLSHDSMIPKSL